MKKIVNALKNLKKFITAVKQSLEDEELVMRI